MLFRLVCKVFVRTRIKSILIIVLLSISLLLLSLGILQYVLSLRYISAISEEYVTLADIDDTAFQSVFSKFAKTEEAFLDSISNRSPSLGKSTEVYQKFSFLFGYRAGIEEQLDDFHRDNPNVLKYERRMNIGMASDRLKADAIYLDALSDDIQKENCIAYLTVPKTRKKNRFQSGLSINPLTGLVSGTCVMVEVIPPGDAGKVVESKLYLRNDGRYQSNPKSHGRIHTVALFEIDRANSELIEAAKEIKYLKLITPYAEEDGEPLFRVGEKYILTLSNANLFFDWLSLLKEYRKESFDKSILEDPGIYYVDSNPQWYIFSDSLLSDSSEPLGREALSNLVSRCEIPIDVETYSALIHRGDYLTPFSEQAKESLKERGYAGAIRFGSNRLLGVVTDDIRHISEFRNGLINIIEKTDQFDEKGSIYISDAMAQANGVHLGEAITFDLDYLQFKRGVNFYDSDNSGEEKNAYVRFDMIPMELEELKLAEKQLKRTYRVGGIFRIHPDYFRLSLYDNRMDITLSTVFVIESPSELKSALDKFDTAKAEYYENTSYPKTVTGMTCARLHNGEEYRTHYLESLESAGLSDYVLKIDDGGYGEVEAGLLGLKRDAVDFFVYATISGVLLFSIFICLFIWWTGASVKLMALQGAAPSFRRRYILLLGYMEISVSMLVSMVLAWLFSGLFIREEMRSIFDLGDLALLILVFSLGFGVLFSLCSVISLSCKRLM